MSACDTCIKPGACCHDIPFFLDKGWSTMDMLILFATYQHELNPEIGLPFHSPIRKPTTRYSDKNMWVAQCLYIRDDGRCGNYENRPHWPCGAYLPGNDPLCVHYVERIDLCPDLAEPTPTFIEYEKERIV